MPKNPSSPSLVRTSRGMDLARSHSAAWGAISRAAKSRAMARISRRCSATSGAIRSGVLIDPAAALPAQTARRDHLAEQRAGAVLVVPQPTLQHLENRETHVQAD